MKDFITFRKMIAPILLKILFWPALAANIFFSVWLIVEGNWIGIVPLFVGSLFIRVIFEIFLLLFTMNENLFEIRRSLRDMKVES
jgi:hypothetical protein